MPARIVLSHDEQLARLAADCPEAMPHAVVAGDPCLDRLLASAPWRAEYRTALGLRPGVRLIVVTSTWGPASLLGRHPDLLERLLAALPADEYRLAAILHPGIWYEHSPWKVRGNLADCLRAGLLLIPPREGWRATLVAADCVIGDHGSVTLYGAALGRPVLTAGFTPTEIAPETAMADLGNRARRLTRPYRDSIDRAIADGPLGLDVVAAPGRSAEQIQSLLYGLLDLPPLAAPRVSAVPPPVPDTVAWDEAPAVPAFLATVRGSHVERFPAAVHPDVPGAHLVVDDTEPDPSLRRMADVLVRRGDGRTAERPLADVFTDHNCLLAADITPGHCLVRLRDGRSFGYATTLPDPSVLASIAYDRYVAE